MDKRTFKRQALNHTGNFSSPYHNPQPCIIKDFCKSGLFIAFDYQDGELLRNDACPFKVGDDIFVNFEAAKPIALKYRIIARVARVLDDAMGLQIIQDNPEATHALYTLARNGSTSVETTTKHSVTQQDQKLLTSSKAIVNGFLHSVGKRIFNEVTDSLMLQASSATSNAEETEYFEAISKLNKVQANVSKAFQLEVMKEVEHWIEGTDVNLPIVSMEQPDETITLVDKDDFEDWLVVKVIISKAEQRLKKNLFELQVRMSEISPKTVSDRNNPLNPTFVCHAFYHTVSGLGLDRKMMATVFETFDEHVVGRLEDLYDQLNQHLAAAGILPEIDYAVIKAAGSDTNNRAETVQSPEATALPAATSPEATPTGTAASGAGQSAEPQTIVPIKPDLQATHQPAEAANGQARAAATQHDSAFSRFQSQQRIAKQAFSTAQNLLKLQKQLTPETVDPGQANTIPDAATSAAEALITPCYYAAENVVEGLNKLQVNTTDGIDPQASLLERVRTVLPDSGGQLREDDINTIDITENLFRAMTNNPALQDTIKPNIKQLEVPLLKILMSDMQFFENEQHPARLVLNRLAKLGMHGSQLNKATEENINHLVERVSTEFDQDTGVFGEVLEALDDILGKQQEIAHRNTKRVVESCEGLQAIQKAKNEVRALINEHCGGKWVPKVLIALLDQGWRELLVFTMLRDGKQSSIYKGYARVVETLSLLSPKAEANTKHLDQGAGLLKIIEMGIKEAPTGKSQLTKLLPGLRQLLEPEAGSPAPDFTEVAEDMETPDAAFSSIDDAKIQDKAFARWIKRARRLKVGDWVEFSGNDEVLQIRLAWLGDGHQSFVFVNHQGMKVIQFKLDEVATHLQAGSARHISDPDQPFVDQSLDKMVQSMYEQMNYQATHDDITGLINRKEFDRVLALALDESKHKQLEHVMLHLDLDQFKVVNNSCGHDAGNQLLKKIVGVINQVVPEDSTVAHFGADEYGLLLHNITCKAATKLANALRNKIQAYRFKWEERSYAVGASIGLFVIDETVNSVPDIINGSDSARLSAKEAGRNRVHVYELDDEERTSREEVMEKIARLNDALDEERLLLRCQKIAPVDPASGLRPHYEILLSIEDEQGMQLAPGDFIQAAERYNRMHEVDRWVIRNVFRWMAANKPKLDKLAGVTINLSSHSLNDEGLMSYIFEELLTNDIPREKVCFEITETVAVTNLADLADFIGEMKGLGFKFALDDFGTGLSSYKYLRTLPVDLLKIDGAFIKNIATDPADFAMVKSINEMAHMMGKKTVAEYVENDAILEKLREIGIDYAQGFGIEKPLLLNSVAEKAA